MYIYNYSLDKTMIIVCAYMCSFTAGFSAKCGEFLDKTCSIGCLVSLLNFHSVWSNDYRINGAFGVYKIWENLVNTKFGNTM